MAESQRPQEPKVSPKVQARIDAALAEAEAARYPVGSPEWRKAFTRMLELQREATRPD